MSELSKEMFCQPNYERVLLAYCFVSVENYYIIASAIDSKDFLLPDHEMIWLIIGTLIKRNVPKVDGELVLNEADHNGVLQKIGGYDYIRSIMSLLTLPIMSVAVTSSLRASTSVLDIFLLNELCS